VCAPLREGDSPREGIDPLPVSPLVKGRNGAVTVAAENAECAFSCCLGAHCFTTWPPGAVYAEVWGRAAGADDGARSSRYWEKRDARLQGRL